MLLEAFPTVETCNNHSGSVGPGGLRPRRSNTLLQTSTPTMQLISLTYGAWCMGVKEY